MYVDAKLSAVAGRTPDQRDLPQALLQGVRQLLLVPEEPVDEQQGEGVVRVRLWRLVLEPPPQAARELDAFGDAEPPGDRRDAP